MKQRTTDKLERIEEGHDWQDGQARGGGGTYIGATDTCRYCGLERRWAKDPQNGLPLTYTFTDADGDRLPLASVPDSCEPEPTDA